ncbi:hypothetical protein AB7185_08585 [Providencia rettgeri]|uniref:hypothetical protein n=1 Tax=unclassified Providencia TaxID=2633465 RepID=UPI0013E0748C|nr:MULTISPECIES: hypothetical protein [unclassified Providencia]QIF57095.1 hypothetical protein FVA69_06185 [Providencia sp. 1701011]QIF61141.1 hypothetical protein FVA70_06200 [Providencia sp. 1701091]
MSQLIVIVITTFLAVLVYKKMSRYFKRKGFNYVVDVPRIELILTKANQVPNICVNEINIPLIELGN